VKEWFVENGLVFDIGPSLDDNLSAWMLSEYAEGHEAYVGSHGLAAVAHYHPQVDRQIGSIALPFTRQALKGWQLRCPGVSRLGWPEELLALVVLAMLPAGLQLGFPRQLVWEAALCTWLTVGCYWRPGEPLKLQVNDIIAPWGGQGPHAMWSFRLHPSERKAAASKTNTFDDSVLLDLDPFRQVAPLLPRLKAGKADHEMAFQFTSRQWHTLIQGALVQLNLQRKLVLYQLRHSGPSNDFFHRRRPLAEVKRRGRWLSDKSVRRYEKAARLTEQLSSLPWSLQEAAKQSKARIPKELAAF
jgi:hypothetical protein